MNAPDISIYDDNVPESVTPEGREGSIMRGEYTPSTSMVKEKCSRTRKLFEDATLIVGFFVTFVDRTVVPSCCPGTINLVYKNPSSPKSLR